MDTDGQKMVFPGPLNVSILYSINLMASGEPDLTLIDHVANLGMWWLHCLS